MDLLTHSNCNNEGRGDIDNVRECHELGVNGNESICASSSSKDLQQLPPLIPVPVQMEDEVPVLLAEVELCPNLSLLLDTSTTLETSASSPELQAEGHVLQLPMITEPVIPTPPPTTISTVSNGLQIMTRKRSSLSATANSGISADTTCITPVTPATVISMTPSTSVKACKKTMEKDPNAVAPPKKKKKYTPKPRKTPTTDPINGNPTKNLTKKMPEAESGTTAVISDQATTEVISTQISNPAKPKRPSKPKAPRKPTGNSTKSKSKKGKQIAPILPTEPEMSEDIKCFGREAEEHGANASGSGLQPLVPPLKLHMPKLTKMPPVASSKNKPQAISNAASKMKPKEEPQDWDENGHGLDPLMLADTELNEDASYETGNGKGTSRKKKSKGRNGNIYIGVFNRIEWMKLQTEFGFGTVNNFGTFVLQTMRRVHGDIQFWCDIAEASGVYPELGRYEWVNGFPHAVNKEGQHFTPPANITMSDEKRDNVIQMAKTMWDQRLQKLKQEQTSVGEEVVLGVGTEDGEEEEEDAMPGLDSYLENMASGQYSQQQSSELISKEEVNKVWTEQMSDTNTLEKYGKLFNFINGIETNGDIPEQEKMDEDEEEKDSEKNEDVDVEVI